jgi:hypothetical protein
MPTRIVNQVGHVAYGKVDSTGAAISVTTGFKPSVVLLYNVGGLVNAEWFDGMGDGKALKQVTAGTISFISSGGITLSENGFSIGTDSDINPAGGEDIYYLAIG